MNSTARIIFFLFGFVCIFISIPFPLAYADTGITTDIVSDTIWTTDGSPYVVSGIVKVVKGATLTIEPGVVVEFEPNAGMQISGQLYADKGIGRTTLFTSHAATPRPGDYTGVSFMEGATGVLSGAHFQYATIPLSLQYDSTLVHHDNTFSDNTNDGVALVRYVSGNITFTRGDGPYVLLSDVATHSAVVTIEPGVVLRSPTAAKHSITLNKGRLVALGTNTDRIQIDVRIAVSDHVDVTIENADIDRITAANTVTMRLVNVTLESFVANQSSTVTAEGIVVTEKTNTSSVGFHSSLTLKNSYIKSSVASNGALVVTDNSNATLTNTRITGLNIGIGIYKSSAANVRTSVITNCSDAGILVAYNSTAGGIDGDFLDIRDSEISGNNHGIELRYHPSFFMTGSSLHDNGVSILNSTSFTYAAPKNWWGDATGPYNVKTNLAGLGNAVSDKIIFTPWLLLAPTLSLPQPLPEPAPESDPAPLPIPIPDPVPAPVPDPVPEADPAPILKRTPVLIIPGVLGTEISKVTDDGEEKLWLDLAHNVTDIGDQFMDTLGFTDELVPEKNNLSIGGVLQKKVANAGGVQFPLFDYSAGLLQEFKNQGYVENTDLFLFPYDWRYGVSDTGVGELRQKITDIITATGVTKIDAVVHSTGGLLLKKYVMENPIDNHIGKAVFVGVPNTGAPKAVKTLLMGDSFDNPFLASSEMKKLARNFPVVYDLAPSQQYYDRKGSYVKIIDQARFGSRTNRDLNFDQTNTFLANDHSLNTLAISHASTLHTSEFDNYDLRFAGVDLYSIDGCKTGTIGKMTEVRAKDAFGTTFVSYLAPTEVPGDGTVPLESSTNLPIDAAHKFYALKADHGTMLSQDGTRQQIVNLISGSNLPITSSSHHDLITQAIGQCKLNGRAISIYSPLSIEITDQDGNRAGLSSDGDGIENTIPNADYEIMGEHKFVYLSTEDGEQYTIQVKGTGTGEFTLTDATIENNIVERTQVFSAVSVTPILNGAVILGEQTTLVLDTNGDSATDTTLVPSFILNTEESENFDPEQHQSEESIIPPEILPEIIAPPAQQGGHGVAMIPFVQTTSSTQEKSEGNVKTEEPSPVLVEVTDPKEEVKLEEKSVTLESSFLTKKDVDTYESGEIPQVGAIPLEALALSGSSLSDNLKVFAMSLAGLGILWILGKKYIKR